MYKMLHGPPVTNISVFSIRKLQRAVTILHYDISLSTTGANIQ